MNSGHKADELAQTTAEHAKRQTYAIIEPGPVLKCYVDGALIVEAELTPTVALRTAIALLREIQL